MAKHLFLDLSGCRKGVLDDPKFLQDNLREVLGNDTFIVEHFHHFSPGGVSGIIRTANHCLSIHTWPEYDYAAIDVLCYEDGGREELIAQQIIQKLEARQSFLQILDRDLNE